jgi:hypothetical protein
MRVFNAPYRLHYFDTIPFSCALAWSREARRRSAMELDVGMCLCFFLFMCHYSSES